MVTLKFRVEATFKEKDLLEYLDCLVDNNVAKKVKKLKPTELDLEVKALSKQLISLNILECSDWDDIDPTEHNGFNELELKIKYYLSLKCNSPKKYERLKKELGDN